MSLYCKKVFTICILTSLTLGSEINEDLNIHKNGDPNTISNCFNCIPKSDLNSSSNPSNNCPNLTSNDTSQLRSKVDAILKKNYISLNWEDFEFLIDTLWNDNYQICSYKREKILEKLYKKAIVTEEDILELYNLGKSYQDDTKQKSCIEKMIKDDNKYLQKVFSNKFFYRFPEGTPMISECIILHTFVLAIKKNEKIYRIFYNTFKRENLVFVLCGQIEEKTYIKNTIDYVLEKYKKKITNYMGETYDYVLDKTSTAPYIKFLVVNFIKQHLFPKFCGKYSKIFCDLFHSVHRCESYREREKEYKFPVSSHDLLNVNLNFEDEFAKFCSHLILVTLHEINHCIFRCCCVLENDTDFSFFKNNSLYYDDPKFIKYCEQKNFESLKHLKYLKTFKNYIYNVPTIDEILNFNINNNILKGHTCYSLKAINQDKNNSKEVDFQEIVCNYFSILRLYYKVLFSIDHPGFYEFIEKKRIKINKDTPLDDFKKYYDSYLEYVSHPYRESKLEFEFLMFLNKEGIKIDKDTSSDDFERYYNFYLQKTGKTYRSKIDKETFQSFISDVKIFYICSPSSNYIKAYDEYVNKIRGRFYSDEIKKCKNGINECIKNLKPLILETNFNECLADTFALVNMPSQQPIKGMFAVNMMMNKYFESFS